MKNPKYDEGGQMVSKWRIIQLEKQAKRDGVLVQ
jgi:hypothetical protein